MPFDGDRVLDSAGLLALETVPASLCVIGGGYIGLELGTALAKLGSKVTIVEAADDLASGFESRRCSDRPAFARASRSHDPVRGRRQIARSGVRSPLTRARGTQSGCRRSGFWCLSAAVQTPSPSGWISSASRSMRVGKVIVDDAGLALPHIAAVGDVVDGPALAHKATAEASAAVAALGGRRSSRTLAKVPLVMFTDPEVASVGLTPDEAEQEGIDAGTATAPFSAIGRAMTLGHPEGFVRLVFDRADETVVGAQITGAHASGFVAEATLAIEMGATVEDLALTIHAHPTLSEGVSEAAELAANHPLHLITGVVREFARS